MVGITERNKQKIELANSGFSMRYIDEWQPKTTLYRHRASLTVGGAMGEDVGTSVVGVPGNPDYVLRKAKIGLFPWKPNESCECKWCRETFSELARQKAASAKVEITDGKVAKTCDICGFKAEAKNSAGASSKLTFHKRASHANIES